MTTSMLSKSLSILLPGLLALAALVNGAGCSAPASSGEQVVGDDLSGKLVLTGSSTVAPLALEIAKRFEQRHPAVRIDVQTGGSSRGMADARNGLADVGLVSRELKADESDLSAFPIARDGVCLIVHRDNPVAALTDDEVRAIYTGKISNWSELGGKDQSITVVNKAEGRSTLEVFVGYFNLSVAEIEADIVIGDNQHGIKTVAGAPAAIGYVSIGSAETDRALGAPIRLLPVRGIAATTENVRRELFPVSRTLNLVTASQPSQLAARFIEFAQSPDNRDLVEELSFVPLGP